MRHAGPGALKILGPLLEVLRRVPGLREKSRGVFYAGPRAALHFHSAGTALKIR